MKPALFLLLLFIFQITGMAQVHVLWKDMPVPNNGTERAIYGDRVQRFIILSENHFRQGNQVEALNQMDNAINAAPENPEVYLHRALLRYRLGMVNEANQDIQKATRLSPTAPTLFGLEGPGEQLDLLAFYPEELFMELTGEERALFVTALYEEEKQADQWIQDIRQNPEAFLWSAPVKQLQDLAARDNTPFYSQLLSMVLLSRDQYTDVAAILRENLDKHPNDGISWYLMGVAQHYMGNQEVAILHYNRALSLKPELYLISFDRALSYIDLEEYQKAADDFTLFLRNSDQGFMADLAYFNRALAFKNIGQFSFALEDLTNYLTIADDNPAAWKVRGNLHLIMGFHKKAIADFSKAIDLNSSYGEAYFNRGIAHLLDNNSILACFDFEKSVGEGYQKGQDKQLYFCN